MLITAIPPIALTVGANRVVRGIAIPHPVGDPREDSATELELRKELLKKALEALSTPITEQTVLS